MMFEGPILKSIEKEFDPAEPSITATKLANAFTAEQIPTLALPNPEMLDQLSIGLIESIRNGPDQLNDLELYADDLKIIGKGTRSRAQNIERISLVPIICGATGVGLSCLLATLGHTEAARNVGVYGAIVSTLILTAGSVIRIDAQEIKHKAEKLIHNKKEWKGIANNWHQTRLTN